MGEFQSQTEMKLIRLESEKQSLLMTANKIKTLTKSPKHEARSSVERTKMEQNARGLQQIHDKRSM